MPLAGAHLRESRRESLTALEDSYLQLQRAVKKVENSLETKLDLYGPVAKVTSLDDEGSKEEESKGYNPYLQA